MYTNCNQIVYIFFFYLCYTNINLKGESIMKKKILIISIVVVLVFMLVAGAVGIIFMIRAKNQKILKAEINGIIFETFGYGERNDLRLLDDKYNYSLITEVELSITNTNSTQFSFQPKLLSMDLNDGYHFNFSSVKNTATNENFNQSQNW